MLLSKILLGLDIQKKYEDLYPNELENCYKPFKLFIKKECVIDRYNELEMKTDVKDVGFPPKSAGFLGVPKRQGHGFIFLFLMLVHLFLIEPNVTKDACGSPL